MAKQSVTTIHKMTSERKHFECTISNLFAFKLIFVVGLIIWLGTNYT